MMILDDLVAVWRSQDAAPLHGVDQIRPCFIRRCGKSRRKCRQNGAKRDGLLPCQRRFGHCAGGFGRRDNLHPRAQSFDWVGFRHCYCRSGRRPDRRGAPCIQTASGRRGARNALASCVLARIETGRHASGAFVISPLPHFEQRNTDRSGPFPPDAFCCAPILSTTTRSVTLMPVPTLPDRSYSRNLLGKISSPGIEGFSSFHIILHTMSPLIPRR